MDEGVEVKRGELERERSNASIGKVKTAEEGWRVEIRKLK